MSIAESVEVGLLVGILALLMRIGPLGTAQELEPLRVLVVLGVLIYVFTSERVLMDGGVLVGILMLWVLGATMANGRMSLGIAYSSVSLFSLFILAKDYGGRSARLRRALIVLGVLVVVLNAVSMTHPGVGPDGNPTYFVGGKNALAVTFMPFFYIFAEVWRPQNRLASLVRLATYTLMVWSIFIGGSGTGKVFAVLSVLFIVTRRFVGKPWRLWFISIPVLHIVLVRGWLLEHSDWARELVEQGLGKDLTFTARSQIWDFAYGQSLYRPFGIGRGYTEIQDRFFGVAETHNMFLESLLTSGWIGLTLLLSIIAYVMKRSSRRDGFGVASVWAAGLLGTMESITYHEGLWLLLGLVAANGLLPIKGALTNRRDQG